MYKSKRTNWFKSVLAGTALIVASHANAIYVGDPRDPTFTKHGIRFSCSFQEEFYSINVLKWNGNAWVSWGGTPDERGEIFPFIWDDLIMSYGSLYKFTTYVMNECERRAEIHASLPYPHPDDRIARFKYALKMLINTSPDGEHIIMPPAPLP